MARPLEARLPAASFQGEDRGIFRRQVEEYPWGYHADGLAGAKKLTYLFTIWKEKSRPTPPNTASQIHNIA